ncbi:MAG: oligosaccharide flippase family protein [Terriglobales bacterium]
MSASHADVVEPESIGIRLLRGTSLLAAGSAVARAVGLLTAILTARWLSLAEFGGYGLIQTTIGLFGLLAGLALGQAATRYVALYRTTDPDRMRETAWFVLLTSVVACVLAAAALMLAAGPLASGPLRNADLAGPLRWSAVQMAASVWFGIIGGIHSGQEHFMITVHGTLVHTVVALLGTLTLVPMLRLPGAIAAQALGFVGGTLVMCKGLPALLRTPLSPLQLWRRNSAILRDFCLPSLLGSCLIVPGSWLAETIIARQAHGYAALALFGAADRYRRVLVFATSFLGSALLPVASGASGVSRQDARRALDLSLVGSAVLVLPLASALIFAGPILMSAFGTAYAHGWNVVIPVVALGSLTAIGAAVGVGLTATGRMWLQAAQWSVYGVIVVLMTYLLRSQGAFGLVAAHLVALSVLLLWSTLALHSDGTLDHRSVITLVLAVAWTATIGLASWYCQGAWRVTAGLGAAGAISILIWRGLMRPAERKSIRAAWARQWGALGRSLHPPEAIR